uniref:RRM Nup35-type domain-containing protein n=1 Tax=Compsopogon caeruleus TaxID=31354 RepID=A0A7S1XBP0_9RHOD|mmetsp:Transcript_13255/g.26928  ORF Transcript_13255/g.26928 Transcript_13255/m.26928 type:complete len:320 (+) Transcript_13255:90-1049(+)
MSGWSSTGGGRRRSLDGGGNEFGFDRPMISTRNMDFATGNSTKGADLVPGMSGVGVYVPREGPSLLSPTAGASIGERGTADLGGNNQQRKKERLKNYLLSSGYTPNPRADGEGAQDDRVMNLLGSVNIYGSNDSGAAKSAAYNERLRAGTSGVALGTRGAKPTENPSQGGLLASPSNHQNNSRGHIRPPPRRSMLDEGGPDVASTIDEICVAQGDVAYGNQGGLFTPAPSHRGDVRTPMDATVLVTPTPQRKTTLFAHEGDGEGCWITVFGFGSAMQSVVLREFRAHGEIVRHIPGKGNWIHILVSPLSIVVFWRNVLI